MGYGHGTRLSVYLDKKGLRPPLEQSEEMYWGTRIEPLLIEEFGRRTGLRVLRNDEVDLPNLERLLDDRGEERLVVSDPADPRIMATPDAFFRDEGGLLGILECKTTGYRSGHLWAEQPPMAGQIQLQWNMRASGLLHGALVCLIGGQRFVGYRDDRHEAALRRVVDDVRVFLRLNVDACVEPEPVAEDYDLVRAIAGKERGTTVTLPQEAVQLDSLLRQTELQLDHLGEARDQMRAIMIRWIGEHSFGEIPGTGVTYTYHTQQRGDAEFRVLRRQERHK